MKSLQHVALLTTTAALAACGGTTPPVGISAGAAPPATPRQSVGGARSMQLLYVAENSLSKIDVYDAGKYDAGPVAEITAGVDDPVGLCIGADGVLYVANNSSNSISEYEPGKTTPFQTITDGLDFPEYCALDSRGNLWVTNLAGSVTEYKKGTTTPRTTITNGVSLPTGIAFDRSGNLYVANLDAESGYVAVYAEGGKVPSRTITDGIWDADGIAVDTKGTLYVTNLVTQTGNYGDVEEYKAGQNQPYQTIGHLDSPEDVIVNNAGYAYVSENHTPAVVVFKRGSTKPWHEFRQGMNGPAGIAYYVGTPP
ncbi:MAG TPA: hypothetical protein VKR56_11445 [Candidatus Cybelea sp.]|nr:hypothetical protein [Candidatus Cybelea sp.]